MSIYWILVAAVIGLGMITPQKGRYRNIYIVSMAALHAFVCGFRYMYLTGDLQKYAYDYSQMTSYGWFSDQVLHEGRNAGFFWLMKLFSTWTRGDFQIFLIALAIATQIIVAVLIYKYSPKPWLSYLVYNCMGFYVAGFSLIKQYLAMAIIMWAMMAVFEKKPVRFLILVFVAGLIHTPALCFLPAYFLANRRVTGRTLIGYSLSSFVIFLFRKPIVDYISEFYYEEEKFTLVTKTLGGRFLVILIILITGLLLRGFKEKNYERIFNMIVIAAMLQMFSGFDNVFTRLTDYYLQFLVLFIPMMFYAFPGKIEVNPKASTALFPFNKKSMNILVLLLIFVLLWWYYTTCIGVTIEYAVDDYTNFRFMWDVA